jgi:phage shock protein PspC (stress-responsive transcriptional regulator)
MTNAAPQPTPTDQPSADQIPPTRPQLRRSDTVRMAGGVCGGLADYSGIDALLWRVGFVGLTVAGGAGIPIYLLLWVLMPPAADRGEPVSALEGLVRRMHAALVNSGLTSPPR